MTSAKFRRESLCGNSTYGTVAESHDAFKCGYTVVTMPNQFAEELKRPPDHSTVVGY
jgi:hypothetical protein